MKCPEKQDTLFSAEPTDVCLTEGCTRYVSPGGYIWCSRCLVEELSTRQCGSPGSFSGGNFDFGTPDYDFLARSPDAAEYELDDLYFLFFK